MERVAFMMKLKKDMMEEYRKRHDNIWSEMKEALMESGRLNYSIWYLDDIIFGYYEVENKELSQKLLNNNAVFIQWNNYMSDLLLLQKEWSNKTHHEMEMIYHLK